MINEKNEIHSLLCKLGISELGSIEVFYPKVRDRDDVSVLRCRKSGVIFLSGTSHIEQKYYQQKEGLSYWEAGSRKQALAQTYEDDHRRANQFREIICNKSWLDIGTGAGGILDLLSPVASKTVAIEPQQGIRSELLKLGYNVFSDIEEMQQGSFDVITLFHVFEHFTQPLEMLKSIKQRLKPGGKVVIEIPHANDFLISFLGIESFKAFTFWSEHLILHTRQSLETFLAHAGFGKISIQGFQRYPLANHLHWLSRNKPGGHVVWSQLNPQALEHAYADMLAKLDQTDTLIAIAENP